MTRVDLGHLNPDCPLIPLDEDEVCGDNPDPPEVIYMEIIECSAPNRGPEFGSPEFGTFACKKSQVSSPKFGISIGSTVNEKAKL